MEGTPTDSTTAAIVAAMQPQICKNKNALMQAYAHSSLCSIRKALCVCARKGGHASDYSRAEPRDLRSQAWSQGAKFPTKFPIPECQHVSFIAACVGRRSSSRNRPGPGRA